MGDISQRIAIVGFGPRGLAALEALVRLASDGNERLAVDLFDPLDHPAAGPNFRPDESPQCLLNLPLRSIDLPPPPRGGIQERFADWLGDRGSDGEAFLPRAWLGGYLNARFSALLSKLPDGISVRLHRLRVTSLERGAAGWRVGGNDTAHGPYDHILLSLGQPESGDDDQLERWRAHADRHRLALVSAYPGTALIRAAADWAGKTVAIRGLALSALDAVNLLTAGLGGRFVDGRYVASGREPAKIVPFSLDGQPPAPKPESDALDRRFDPLADEDAGFEAGLRTALHGPPATTLETIAAALERPAMRILVAAGSDTASAEVRSWLEMERERTGCQERRGTVEALRASIAEAEGSAPPSIGYVVGQLWRKWQPALRRIYDAHPVGGETAEALVRFDEGLKRYSYGAPVGSARRLLRLIECGLVDPYAADDPDIDLTADGWRLKSGDRAVTADVMVDAVLAPASLAPVTEPLVGALKDGETITSLGEKLGAATSAEAALLGPDGAAVDGLWLVGRLASGSAIACDSIHDCFGDITDRWARTVLAPKERSDR